ncbi:AEC family transporter [Egbenema bharatensis]|uniref:AEC family transporter n=1 Tax=Egbenema bharatensis TaxID=3463334 RepID=UPI003A83772F
MPVLQTLLPLYIPLVGWVTLGVILGRVLPRSVPERLGKFLFWIGVPASIMIFLRQADLTASVWLAPLVSWIAVLLGAALAVLWIKGQVYLAIGSSRSSRSSPRSISVSAKARTSGLKSHLSHWLSPQQLRQKPTQGSFLLSTMVGNTGYLGYPVALTLVGPQYFGWAVFYDTLGSTLAAYGLGVVLAAYFGMKSSRGRELLGALVKNPALWSFWVGLWLRTVTFPDAVELGLQGIAWLIIGLSLLLLGMRLSRIQSWRNVQQASVGLGIKMVLVPLILGYGLQFLGITGLPHLVLVLQMGMPPAFATLVIAEAYDLDRELTVTTLALGSVIILLTLPVWLWLFG